MGGMRRAVANSVSPPRDDWCTPEEILNPVRRVFDDRIDFDPCSNPKSIVYAREVIMLPVHRTTPVPKHTEQVLFGDGLVLPWDGHKNGYVNPPYGRQPNKLWAQRIWRYSKKLPLIALVPGSYGAVWWDYYWAAASSVCQLRGRLQFLGAPSKADFESAVVYTGPNTRAFEDAFAPLGRVIHTSRVLYTGPWGPRGRGLT